jgi:hypothetical protein
MTTITVRMIGTFALFSVKQTHKSCGSQQTQSGREEQGKGCIEG